MEEDGRSQEEGAAVDEEGTEEGGAVDQSELQAEEAEIERMQAALAATNQRLEQARVEAEAAATRPAGVAMMGYLSKMPKKKMLQSFQKRFFVLSTEGMLSYTMTREDAMAGVLSGEKAIAVKGAVVAVEPAQKGITDLRICLVAPGNDRVHLLEAYSNREKIQWIQALQSVGGTQEFRTILIENGVPKVQSLLQSAGHKLSSRNFFIEDKKCAVCGAVFGYFKTRQNCRECGCAVCAKCSSHKTFIQKLGYEAKVCDRCNDHRWSNEMRSGSMSDDLPEEWEPGRQGDKKFYVNKDTGESRWTKPT